ncbi:MAG: single-stranded-DNA-specific exonuclease RecJ [Thermoplasmatota archaeon]
MDTLKAQEWRYRKEDIGLAGSFSEKLDIHPLLARILVSRSIKDTQEVYEFLHPTLRNLHDPFLFDDMDTAVGRIGAAIRSGEGITVHGDYDVDGISSTALLLTAIRSAEEPVKLHHFLPSRFDEGYGLSLTCLDEMEERGDRLLITVDCGVKAVDQARAAADRGFEVIITDHHEPGTEIPKAAAVIDPKIPGSGYPFTDLAGVGVAFKLATGLQMREVIELDVRSLLDLVALGTVSDLVPLTDENRALVHFGLEQLRSTKHIGLSTLISESGLDTRKDIKAGDISFKLGPRLNSAGRLAHPGMALDLLMTGDRFDAELFARELSTLNYKRQAIGKKLVSEVLQEVDSSGRSEDPLLFIGKEGWNPGVIGVSAAKMVEMTGKPSVILSIENGIAKGSARAPRGFNMVEALHDISDLLMEHGGHERAAGLTLSAENLDAARERLCRFVDNRYPDHLFTPLIEIDLDLDLSEIDLEAVLSLDRLGPFGMGNPQPVVSIRESMIGYDLSRVGDGKHLKFSLTNEDRTIGCIWFNMGDLADDLRPGTIVTAAGFPEVHSWRGNEEVQLRVLDLSIDG